MFRSQYYQRSLWESRRNVWKTEDAVNLKMPSEKSVLGGNN